MQKMRGVHVAIEVRWMWKLRDTTWFWPRMSRNRWAWFVACILYPGIQLLKPLVSFVTGHKGRILQYRQYALSLNYLGRSVVLPLCSFLMNTQTLNILLRRTDVVAFPTLAITPSSQRVLRHQLTPYHVHLTYHSCPPSWLNGVHMHLETRYRARRHGQSWQLTLSPTAPRRLY